MLGEAVVEVSIAITVILVWVARQRIPSPPFDPMATLKAASMRLLLAVSVLIGLVLNAAFGLWKADPLSALTIAGFFFYTGEHLLRGGKTGNRTRSSLPNPGDLMASIVAYIGAEETEQPSLRVIICGGGRLVLQTARALDERGHRVTVIDEDLERCRALSGEGAAEIVCGDATSPKTLRRAGLERCDVVAALSDSARTNDRICQVVQREASVRTIMRAPFHAKAGGDSYERKGIRELGGLDGDLRILELRVEANAPIAGRRLYDVQLPRGGRVLSRPNGEEVKVEETVFAPGDAYVVAAGEEAACDMIRLFRGKQSSNETAK